MSQITAAEAVLKSPQILTRPRVAFRVGVTRTWVARALVFTLLFNVIDTILTIILVTAGHAVEANPLMAKLLMLSPAHFVIGKLTMVFAGVWILWRTRARRIAVLGTSVVFGVYLLLMIYHMHSLHVLLG